MATTWHFSLITESCQTGISFLPSAGRQEVPSRTKSQVLSGTTPFPFRTCGCLKSKDKGIYNSLTAYNRYTYERILSTFLQDIVQSTHEGAIAEGRIWLEGTAIQKK